MVRGSSGSVELPHDSRRRSCRAHPARTGRLRLQPIFLDARRPLVEVAEANPARGDDDVRDTRPAEALPPVRPYLEVQRAISLELHSRRYLRLAIDLHRLLPGPTDHYRATRTRGQVRVLSRRREGIEHDLQARAHRDPDERRLR